MGRLMLAYPDFSLIYSPSVQRVHAVLSETSQVVEVLSTRDQVIVCFLKDFS